MFKMLLFLFGMLVAHTVSHTITLLDVPRWADPRREANLKCEYSQDSLDPPLHSVKWYRDMHEIFRYTPQEYESRAFNSTGVAITNSSCDEQACTITVRPDRGTGKYTCEVSSEGPRFDVDRKSANMTLAVLPEYGPLIIDLPTMVQVGEQALVNCTSDYSLPAATIDWFVDNELQEMPAHRKISMQQMEALIAFLEEHRALAKGQAINTPQAKAAVKRLWDELASLLNGQGMGTSKNGSQWREYWRDLKYRVRKKAGDREVDRRRTGGGPPSSVGLSALEERIYSIMGDRSVVGDVTARIPFDDPLITEDTHISGADSEGLRASWRTLHVYPDDYPTHRGFLAVRCQTTLPTRPPHIRSMSVRLYVAARPHISSYMFSKNNAAVPSSSSAPQLVSKLSWRAALQVLPLLLLNQVPF